MLVHVCGDAAFALCFGTLASGTPINLQRQIEFADGCLARRSWGSRMVAELQGRGETRAGEWSISGGSAAKLHVIKKRCYNFALIGLTRSVLAQWAACATY